MQKRHPLGSITGYSWSGPLPLEQSSCARSSLVTLAAAVLLVAGLPSAAAASAPEPDATRATAESVDVFQTGGDVHYSSTPPPTISAHGWWLDKDSGGAKAKVTVELQILTGGCRHTVATGSKTVKQGGGSSRRANARKTCVGSKATTWRSRVDVDIIGVADSPNKLETPGKTFNCGV
ncbi:hypothetical protein [Streptomyces sp. NPDC060010]|uniref:hypothetical protein n=1 Tax=Streptomyces sp. NPDC060010 TaxID=3347036 RepID=UPI0036BDC957